MLLLALFPAIAGTIVVDPGGAGDATTLAAGLALATNGDRIEVAPGTYVEDVDFQARSVALVGVEGSAVTVIEGTGAASVVRIDSGEAAGTRLEGFTVRGGDATTTTGSGGALYVSGVPLTAVDLVLGLSRAEFGGGLFVGEATGVVLEGVVAEGNQGRVGAGAYFYNAEVVASELTLRENTAALDADAFGGGLVVYGGSATLSELVCADNSALVGGGGAYVGGGAVVSCLGCAWERNSAPRGGGLYTTESAAVTLLASSLSGNASTDYGGGAATRSGAVLEVEGVWVEGNTAPFGAGILVSGATLQGSRLTAARNSGDGGAGVYADGGNVDLSLSTFVENVAATSNGGAVALDGANGVFTNVVFAANQGYSGAAVHVNDGSVATITNATMTEGASTSSAGGVRVTAAGTLTLRNSIIAWSRDGSGISAAAGAVTLLSYNDLYLNEGGPTSSDLPDPTGTYGNVAVDPMFVAFADDGVGSDDLHLQAASPVVDAGDPGLLDADGSPSDLGAYGGPLGASWEAQDADGDGVTEAGGDCDDGDPDTYPGAPDGCDELDTDCDGVAAEDCDTGNEPGDDTGENGGGNGGDNGGGNGGETGGDNAGDNGSGDKAGGCGCTTGAAAPGWMGALLGVLALRRRR